MIRYRFCHQKFVTEQTLNGYLKKNIGINPVGVLDPQTGYSAELATPFDPIYPKVS